MEKFNASIAIRLKPQDKKDFVRRCDAYGVAPQELLREIITAFINGKLRIVVPENQLKILKGIHTHES